MKKQMMRLFIIVLAGLCLLIPLIANAGFSEDLNMLDQKALSVLMLDIYDKDFNLIATGSGFVAFSGRYLVTNAHVMEDAHYIAASSDDGYEYYISDLLAVDAAKDIAILAFIYPTDRTPLKLASDEQLIRRGERVVAIGSPKGMQNSISKGDVSAVFEESDVRFIQFTAPISSGSSGGALFNDEGTVIGITTMILNDAQNMNYAIDVREAVALYDANKDKQLTSLDEYIDSSQSAEILAPSPAPSSTQTPEPSQPPNKGLRDLNISILINNATITWSADQRADQYYIGWTINDNPYYNYDQTSYKFYFLSDLLPDVTYQFYVSTSRDMKENVLTKEITMPPAKGFNKRNFQFHGGNLYFNYSGADITDAKKDADIITKEEMKRAGVTRDYYFWVEYSMEAGKESTSSWQVVLRTPINEIYYENRTFVFSQNAKQGNAIYGEMNNLFQELFKYGSCVSGEYQIYLYADHQFAGKAAFNVE